MLFDTPAGGGTNAPVCSKRSRPASACGDVRRTTAKLAGVVPAMVVQAAPLGQHPGFTFYSQDTSYTTSITCAPAPTQATGGTVTVEPFSPKGLTKHIGRGCAAPTPAHVQAELLLNGVSDTPRAATAALLTMAAQRVESSEIC